jgi:hypothetical protein
MSATIKAGKVNFYAENRGFNGVVLDSFAPAFYKTTHLRGPVASS